MYEAHFGLSKNPFQSIAEGEAVFEGPEQAKIITGLRTALTAKDSIAVVTGPVGVGKTTIVQRALEEAAPDRLVARLGRTAIASDELVDLLLAQFGVVREPTRRFECLKTFNRILNEHAESGARVFIVIEDAERLGAELLEELEALTAADGGASAGANIILMGPQKLDKLITRPALERLRQRIRMQKTLERFNAEEVEAYLRHRINAAGGNYDTIFEQGTVLMVRRCSGGIPRVINGLCETALTLTAENHMAQVTPKIVLKVAVDVFGMSPGDATAGQAPKAAPAPKAPPARRAAPVAKPAPTVAPTPKPRQAAPARTAEPDEERTEPALKAPLPPAAKKVPAAKTAAEKPAESSIAARKAAAAPQQADVPRAPKPPAKPAATPAATDDTAPAAASPMAQPSRVPDPPPAGVKNRAAGTAKPLSARPLPDLPPKFKFADDIVVDKDTKPKLSDKPKKANPSQLTTLDSQDGAPNVAVEKPTAKEAGAAPRATDDIPTLGDSARVERIAAQKSEARPAKPAPRVPEPASVQGSPAPGQQEPPPTVKPRKPEVDEPTASFAKIDHDMLDAALASLAVHDEEDGSEPEIEPARPENDSPEPAEIPEVTLDKAIEERRAAARAATDPAELDRMAAELEQTKSLEEMSDKLAETLFGSQELEAISLQIREQAAPEESPIALETTELAGAQPAPEAARAPAAPQPTVAPQPKAAPVSPAATKPGPNNGVSAEPKDSPATADRGPQPEPIENQFNTSITATLKTLSSRSKPPIDDEDANKRPAGLLGRLKGTFKS